MWLRFAVVLSLLFGLNAGADDALERARASVQKHASGLNVGEVRASPIKGLYHAVLEGQSGYVTEDGRYFIPGDLFEVASRKNLTEEARVASRLALLQRVQAKDEIVFSSAKPKHTILVFTDVDCAYCRKLHSEIADLNARGIEVRYLAYPRSGPQTESGTKMRAVWCAKDRRDALTRAKRGETIAAVSGCAAKQVDEQYALGQEFGVQGTPSIVLADGSLIGGYLPPDELLAELDKRAGK